MPLCRNGTRERGHVFNNINKLKLVKLSIAENFVKCMRWILTDWAINEIRGCTWILRSLKTTCYPCQIQHCWYKFFTWMVLQQPKYNETFTGRKALKLRNALFQFRGYWTLSDAILYFYFFQFIVLLLQALSPYIYFTFWMSALSWRLLKTFFCYQNIIRFLSDHLCKNSRYILEKIQFLLKNSKNLVCFLLKNA